MKEIYPLVFVSLVDLLSIAACFTVLFQIGKLPASNRRRLFPRQVVALALADLFFSCTRLPWDWGGFHEEGLSEWFLFMLYWSYQTTLLAELNIMLGFAMQTCKCTAGLRALARLFWAPPLLASGTALLSVLFRDPDLPWATMQAVSALGALAIALFTIASLLCRRADRTTHAVMYRSWNRAMAFVVNFLITMAPETAFILLYPELYQDTMNGYRLCTTLCTHSNGLVNALTYLYQSRYAHRGVGAPECAATAASLEVHFGGVNAEDLTTRHSLDEAVGEILSTASSRSRDALSTTRDSSAQPGD